MKKIVSLLLALVMAAASFSAALADTGYIVQRGDTVYRIAARFGVSPHAIIAVNGLRNPNLIYVGQRLVIPGPSSAPGNGPQPTPAPWTGQYVVQRGDTLWAISQRFGTTVDAVKRANNLVSNLIFPGQILNLPGAPGPKPTTPAPTPTQPATPATCSIQWFFAQRPNGCPAAPAVDSWAAAQRFERGLMIWVEKTDTYYVFHNINASGALALTKVVGPVALKPGANPNNRVGGAPPGLTEPISGFGLLWRGEMGGVGDIRSQVGWALEPEYGFTTTYQCEAYPVTGFASTTCYLRTPYTGVYQTYYVQGFGNYWRGWP